MNNNNERRVPKFEPQEHNSNTRATKGPPKGTKLCSRAPTSCNQLVLSTNLFTTLPFVLVKLKKAQHHFSHPRKEKKKEKP